MPTVSTDTSNAQPTFLSGVPEALDRLGERYERRTIDLRTSRKDLLAVDYHVQGLARIDHPNDVSSLVCSAGDAPSGSLWIANFHREHYTTPQGRTRTRLAARGTTVSTVRTPTTHPGGMQAAGTWLAVANEDRGITPSVDIYDLARPDSAQLHARLDLHGKRGAGWVALALRGPDDLLLFIGGSDYALNESWLYAYQPSKRRFRLEGSFDARSCGVQWGPVNGGSLFVEPSGRVFLITQGNKSKDGNDVYRERVRCYALSVAAGKVVLAQQPQSAPESYVIDAEPHPAWLGGLYARTAGLRWGSTVFGDQRGELVMYVSERNPLYCDDGFCHLRIVELRQRLA